jgi:arginine transport system substrate-binding protein
MPKKFLSFIILMITACTGNAPDHKTLVLGTDPTYPPYESIALNGECEGFDIDVAKAIAEKLHRTVVIKQFGFTALILALKQKKVDLVLAGMDIIPARQKEISMISYQGAPIHSLYLAFWGAKPPGVHHLTDLDLVAVMVGTAEEDYLRAIPKITYKSLDNTTEIIMDLQYGKSQAALCEPKVAMVLQKRFPELQLLEVPLEEKDWRAGKGIGMEKGNALLIEQVRHAIEELQSEGTIQKLEQKWMAE